MIDFFVGAGVATTGCVIAAAASYLGLRDRFDDAQTQCMNFIRENAALRAKIQSGEARLGKVRADLDNAQAAITKLTDERDYWRAKAQRKASAPALAALKARTTAELRGRA